MRYEGDLNIKNDAFTLEAKPFIFGDKELQFTFWGRDEYGRFHLKGVAKKNENGFFLAPFIPLIYSGHDNIANDEYVTIRFYVVVPSINECKVVGVCRERKAIDGILILSFMNPIPCVST